jgi:hypothetical protein
MKLVFAGLLSGLASADMYFQFPGGSNNRLNEPQRDVRNDNRMFDSQNNNRFGHNQHGHYFNTGSEIDLQWTVQHGCGPDSNVNCEVVLQYACHDQLRDGDTVDTIPEEKESCENGDCNTDFSYGMHETYEDYQKCSLRERNYRLFPADRHIRGENARYTRQENNGERYGYECNEERDYYPYWQPTIWKDIAVFTDKTENCEMYQTESENVKGRWFCDVPKEWMDEKYQPRSSEAFIPWNATACAELAEKEGIEAVWTESAAHTYPDGTPMEAPTCTKAPYQRDNHHGNGENRYFVGHKWTVPDKLVHDQCSFRVRYNISSSDYDGWNTNVDHKIRDDEGCMCRNNYGVDVWSDYGWDGHTAKTRGYRHINDARLKIFDEVNMWLRSAYNTDQLGRVFEDRTHKIAFRKTPEHIQADLDNGARLINLNARGKVGNNVEVYPAFEYDFVPSRINASVNDWVHIQWSGSNTNDRSNDHSQGQIAEVISKDRHNMVVVDELGAIRPTANLEKMANIFGFGETDSMRLALDGVLGGDNEYLQSAGAYFDLGPRKLSEVGKWSFMSTHNNKFGVRSQKGKIIVN